MKTSAEGFRQCYNAQVAVDGEHPWIVATELTSNASDQGAMAGLLDEVEETFDAQPERVLAEITRIGGLVGLSGPFRVPCLPLRTCGVPAFVLIPASIPVRPSAHVLELPFYGAGSWRWIQPFRSCSHGIGRFQALPSATTGATIAT